MRYGKRWTLVRLQNFVENYPKKMNTTSKLKT